MKAALYSRVSTDHQQSAAQVAACRAEIAHRGWELVGEFVDEGVSGVKTSRPALDAMLAAARAGQVEAVVVPALDRLGRSAIHVQQVEQELRRAGIDLVLLREKIDGSTPAGRAMLGMIAIIAELERSLIRDRTRSALAHKRRQRGQQNARAVSDEAIYSLKRKEPRLSVRAIAERLGASKSTVHAVLKAVAHA